MPDKVLLLSYAFPPIAAPESFLSAKAMSDIPGYETDVVCADADANALSQDDSLKEYVQRRFKKIIAVNPPLLLKWLPKNTPFLCQIPDYFIYLNNNLLHYFDSLDLSGYKAVITWSQWHSIHLAGLWIKKKIPSLKWFVHFSDPWIDNPFMHNSGPQYFINKFLEKSVIHKSDAIFFTSPETIQLVMKKYSSLLKGKVYYIPHSFDRDLYDTSLAPSRGLYVIRSLGSFYGHRSPRPIFEAIEKIGRETPELLEGVSFEIVGSLGPYKNLLNNYPFAKEIVCIVGSVSYLDSLRLMQTANCLLVIDAPGQTSVFFPSKLVDYIGAGRFIFAISPEGATLRIIKEIGGVNTNPLNIEETTRALRDILLKRPSSLPTKNYNYEKKNVNILRKNIFDSLLR